MTKQMDNVLKALKALPKRKRSGAAHGLIPFAVLECYDGRTISALIARGALVPHESGYRISE